MSKSILFCIEIPQIMNLTSYIELTTAILGQHTFSPMSQFIIYCRFKLKVDRVIVQAD